MKRVGLYEVKTRLSALVASIEASGETIALTRHGKVVAELRRPNRSAPRRGCLKSKRFVIAEDFDSEALGFEDSWGEPAESDPASTKRVGPDSGR